MAANPPPNTAPTEPDTLIKLNASIGPYPWLAHAAWSGYNHWNKFDERIDHVAKHAEEITKGQQYFSREATAFARRVLRQSRPILVPMVALFPEAFFAWLAVQDQRSVGEWERWQQRKKLAAEAGNVGLSEGPVRAMETQGVAPGTPLYGAIGRVDPLPQGPRADPKAETPSLLPPDESPYQKLERGVVKLGYIPWFASAGYVTWRFLRRVSSPTMRRRLRDYDPELVRKMRQSGAKFRKLPILYIIPAFCAASIFTSPVGGYVWWSKSRVAQRDLALCGPIDQPLPQSPKAERTAETPSLLPPEEPAYQKLERSAAKSGYASWFALAWFITWRNPAMGRRLAAKYDAETSQIARAFGAAPRRVSFANACGAFSVMLAYTSPVGGYIWWSKRRVAQRDLADVRAPSHASMAGEGAQAPGLGEGDGDWLLKGATAAVQSQGWKDGRTETPSTSSVSKPQESAAREW